LRPKGLVEEAAHLVVMGVEPPHLERSGDRPVGPPHPEQDPCRDEASSGGPGAAATRGVAVLIFDRFPMT
jgi:hypothetical protein